MFKRSVFILFFGTIIFMMSTASENGVAEEQNKDRTGTPDGSTTCGQCHESGNFTPFINLSIQNSDGEEVSEYIEGDTLTLRYSVTSFGGGIAQRFGFQSTALNDGLIDAGEFTDPSPQVQLEEVNTVTIPSRHIVEHQAPSPFGIFQVDWVAPADTGPITFYYAGVAANNDGDSSGDNGINGTTVLQPGLSDGLDDRKVSDFSLSIFGDRLSISSAELPLIDELLIHDMNGREIDQLHSIVIPFSFSFNELGNGVYLLSIRNNERWTSKRFLVR